MANGIALSAHSKQGRDHVFNFDAAFFGDAGGADVYVGRFEVLDFFAKTANEMVMRFRVSFVVGHSFGALHGGDLLQFFELL